MRSNYCLLIGISLIIISLSLFYSSIYNIKITEPYQTALFDETNSNEYYQSKLKLRDYQDVIATTESQIIETT